MPRGRKLVVVDTNVAIKANRREGGSYACASECAQHLMALRTNGTLILDSTGLILSEYQNYLNYKGQPGAGDAFLRWFFNNRGKTDLTKEVDLTELHHRWRLFEQFPDDEDLSDFDKADQKFVACAAAAGQGVEILQSSDHKWIGWEPKLRQHGIKISFLCKQELLEVNIRKNSGT